jgi:hypothetical protein
MEANSAAEAEAAAASYIALLRWVKRVPMQAPAAKAETPQERLKRIMQAQLNKQLKKDTVTQTQKKFQVSSEEAAPCCWLAAMLPRAVPRLQQACKPAVLPRAVPRLQQACTLQLTTRCTA